MNRNNTPVVHDERENYYLMRDMLYSRFELKVYKPLTFSDEFDIASKLNTFFRDINVKSL